MAELFVPVADKNASIYEINFYPGTHFPGAPSSWNGTILTPLYRAVPERRTSPIVATSVPELTLSTFGPLLNPISETQRNSSSSLVQRDP